MKRRRQARQTRAEVDAVNAVPEPIADLPREVVVPIDEGNFAKDAIDPRFDRLRSEIKRGDEDKEEVEVEVGVARHAPNYVGRKIEAR